MIAPSRATVNEKIATAVGAVGQKVTVRRGVLVGHSGIVDGLLGDDRLKVLFEMLGRKTIINLNEAETTAA